MNEVETAFERALATPGVFTIVHRGLRRAALKRFPYLVYFRQEEDVIHVFAVLHGRRDRTVLRKRL